MADSVRRIRRRETITIPGREDWTPDDWAHDRRKTRYTRRRSRRRWLRWGRRALWVAGSALAVTVASGLAARWVPPAAGWWFPVAALFLPLLSGLTALVAVGLAVSAIRSRGARHGVAAAVFGMLAVACAVRGHRPPSAPPGVPALRVMTLNLGPATPRESARASLFIQQEAPDLILFQEAPAHVMRDDPDARVFRGSVIDDALASGRYVLARDTAGGPPRMGVSGTLPIDRLPILSRLPVRSVEARYLGPPETSPGVYSRAVVEWQGQEVAVYNVHLRPFNPTRKWAFENLFDPDTWTETPRRLGEYFPLRAEESTRLAIRLVEEPRPIVLGGDFNGTPDLWSRAVLDRRLRESFGGKLWAPTRPSEFPLFEIDGILASPDWGVRRAIVGPGGMSDHRAMVADLAYRGEPPAPR